MTRQETTPRKARSRRAVQTEDIFQASESAPNVLFTTEVINPDGWYDDFKKAQQGDLPRKGFTVGHILLEDEVAQDIRCTVKILGKEKDPSVSFTLQAELDYSDERQEQDGGFNMTGYSVRIANDLREKGTEVKFDTNKFGQQIMYLRKNGIRVAINMGWSSEEEKPDEEELEIFVPCRSSHSKADQIQETEETKELVGMEQEYNSAIEFFLVRDNRSSITINSHTPEDLRKTITEFTGILGEFLTAYYKARGTNPPELPLKLSIPDWENYIGEDPNLYTSEDAVDIVQELFNDNETLSESLETSNDLVGRILSESEKADMPTFKDIGGQPEAVEAARQLAMEIKYSEKFAQRGVTRSNLLLKGPPGTGKTLLARAIAGESGAEFMSLSVTDFVSMWYGEAEQRVQEFFDRVKILTKQDKDVIAFFDEADSLIPVRDGAHEATQKIVSVFLANIGGFHSNPRLTIIAATNYADRIDPAFLRLGRINKQIEMGLPNVDGIQQILEIRLGKRFELLEDPSTFLAPDFDTKRLAARLGKVSGADIEGIINLALQEKTTAEIRFKENIEGGRPWTPLTEDELVAVKQRYVTTPHHKPFAFEKARARN